MPSHSEGPGIWLSVWRFLLTHCLYQRAAEFLARLRGCAGSPEPSLLAYAISTKFAWRGTIFLFPYWPVVRSCSIFIVLWCHATEPFLISYVLVTTILYVRAALSGNVSPHSHWSRLCVHICVASVFLIAWIFDFCTSWRFCHWFQGRIQEVWIGGLSLQWGFDLINLPNFSRNSP